MSAMESILSVASLRDEIKQQTIAEIEKLENELSDITEELFGDAASDYIRASELDEKKNALEERLMEIYEELEASE